VSGHLGADLAAHVDGELGHAARERVLRHLTGCAACRAEVEAQRRLKNSLRDLGGDAPAPSVELRDRLVALGRPEVVAPAAGGPARPPSAPRAPGRPRGPRGRVDGRRPSRRLPRHAVGGAFLALGLGAVLALGGPQRAPTRAPVDPASDAFLVDHVSTSGGLPLPEPVGVTTAGLGR
jgi:anti-sigma factor RsiW